MTTRKFQNCFLSSEKMQTLYGSFMSRVASNTSKKNQSLLLQSDEQKVSQDLLMSQLQADMLKDWK